MQVNETLNDGLKRGYEITLSAAELEAKGVDILSPPINRDFGHRTLFFRDPDGNLIEIANQA